MTLADHRDAMFSPDAFPCGCMVTGGLDANGVREIVYANDYLRELVGNSADAPFPGHLAALFTRASSVMVDTYIIPLVTAEGRCQEMLLELTDGAGSKIPVLANAVLRGGESLIFWSLISAVQRDRLDQELVEARRSLQRQRESLRELSITDELTGLNNRRELMSRCAGAINQATRSDWPLAVLMVDIDHFKALNDEHGHAAGDRVLRDLAHVFREQGRSSDIMARYGGEEFVFVLQGADEEQARQAADRIHCMAQQVDTGPDIAGLTVSIGVAITHDPGTASCEALLERADRALYRAKRGGRNKTEVLTD